MSNLIQDKILALAPAATVKEGEVLTVTVPAENFHAVAEMLRDDREGYEKCCKNFGRQLKVCALNNYGAQKDKLQDLLLFYSSTEKKLVTLGEYVSRMPESQK